MPTINGKKITFYQKLSAGEWWDLLPILAAMSQDEGADAETRGFLIMQRLTWDDVVRLIQGTVESWELDGDPSDRESVDDLDVFLEAIPLLGGISEYIVERTAGLGEAESKSTSA